MPVVQLTTHVKSSTLYSRTVIWLYGRTVVRSYDHTVIRSYGHTVVQLYGRMVGWAYGRTTKFFWLDGLLLFCIIMGLRSASSAINHIFSCEWIRNLQNDPHKKLRLKKKHKKKKSGMDRVQTIVWQAQVESLSKPGEGFFPNNYLDCSLTL